MSILYLDFCTCKMFLVTRLVSYERLQGPYWGGGTVSKDLQHLIDDVVVYSKWLFAAPWNLLRPVSVGLNVYKYSEYINQDAGDL